MINRKFLSSAVFFSFFVLFAHTLVFADDFIDKDLSEHQQWLNLLHYSKESRFSETYQSYIDDEGFFLSPQGNYNPQAELQATVSEFYKPLASIIDPNSHAICRFPARLQWLKQKKLIDSARIPDINCSEFNAWYKEINADSITLIFAAAYLNSPSSMFGHTLIRLDNLQAGSDANWLSYAVNFGANVNNNDNSIAFVYKGLMGGYNGFFHIMPFYKKIQEYSFMENRELWEYRLNLSEIETKRLVLHLWELQNINFAYYYVTENCSFRLLELLQIARPGVQLTDPFEYVTVPSDIIQTIVHYDFVESIHYRLPQSRQLDQQIADINPDNYPFIDGLVKGEISFSDEFKQLPITTQRKLVNTSYQLLRNNTIKNSRTSELAKIKLQLLKRLSTYPKEQESVHVHPIPNSPDQGHASSLTSLTLGYDQKNNYAQVSYRQNYHDLLDNPKGFFSGAAINFFDLDLRLYETGNIKLQKFKLLNITSLSARNYFVKPLSWHIDAGLEYQNYKKDKLSVFFNGGVGESYRLFKKGLSYGFLDLHLEYNPNFKYGIEPGVGIQLGQLYQSVIGSSQLKFDSKIFIDGSYLYSIGFRHNFVLDVDHAVRFSVNKTWNKEDDLNHIELAYRYYF